MYILLPMNTLFSCLNSLSKRGLNNTKSQKKKPARVSKLVHIPKASMPPKKNDTKTKNKTGWMQFDHVSG
jgi:hypothetical protein